MTGRAWTEEQVKTACMAAAKADPMAIDAPSLYEASMRVGEYSATEAIERTSAMLSEVGERVTTALANGDDTIDLRFDAVENGMRDAAVKLGSAALLRGVLIGIALAEDQDDSRSHHEI